MGTAARIATGMSGAGAAGSAGASGGEIAAMSLCEAADAVARGTLGATELVDAALARIDRLDPALHAFIRIEHEAARARALEIDRSHSRSRGAAGPLGGVPLAHKDMYYRAGRVSTCGSRIRHEFRPAATATVLDHLDRAGAIDLGGLAMVEFAMGPHGFNAHLPRCRNVWDFERIPAARPRARAARSPAAWSTPRSAPTPAAPSAARRRPTAWPASTRHGGA